MTRLALSIALVAGLRACSAPAREPKPTTTSLSQTLSSSTAPARPASGAAPAVMHRFSGANGLVRLTYADPLKPGHDFSGRSQMAAGWRLMWDGQGPGPGTGVVTFSEDAKPAQGPGVVSELVQIGFSRDPAVVATCGTTGMQGPNPRREPNRMLGGHRWTVWSNGDAGMSQETDATDWRTVVDGTCYAIDRVAYYVRAEDTPPGLPVQKTAKARIDAVLASVRVGGR